MHCGAATSRRIESNTANTLQCFVGTGLDAGGRFSALQDPQQCLTFISISDRELDAMHPTIDCQRLCSALLHTYGRKNSSKLSKSTAEGAQHTRLQRNIPKCTISYYPHTNIGSGSNLYSRRYRDQVCGSRLRTLVLLVNLWLQIAQYGLHQTVRRYFGYA
jgi:hypothetical protein